MQFVKLCNNGGTSGPEERGEDMPKKKKRQRARVKIGIDENGTPVYKWASGYTKKELKADKDRIRAEYGVADRKDDELPVIKKAPALQTVAPALIIEPAQGEPFKIYAERWYRLYKAPHLRGSSQEMYENVLSKHLYPAMGERPITSITADELQEFIIGYEESSKSLIDKVMMTLRQVFAAALDDGIIGRNPVARLKPPEGTCGDRKPITLEQVGALTKAAICHSDGLLPLLLCYTGLRRGEALGLKWDDIDGEYIHVRRAVTYERNHIAVIGETKTDAGRRDVPIMPVLAERLKSGGRGFIFGGEKVMPYTSFKRLWTRLQGEIDALKGVTPHRLRHTYLMLLRRAGVDAATQQYLMGHSEYDTTVNDYTTIDEVDVGEACQKMNGKLPELLPVLLPQAETAKGI